MSGRFLITGLPRSRTAWWAVATGALHEPISQQGYDAFDWKAGEGVSDAGAGMHLAKILADHACKTLIVERPMAEVIASLALFLEGRQVDWEFIRFKLNDLAEALQHDDPLIKRVRYDDLAIPGVVLSCVQWLGVKPRNLAQLMHMNIQTDLGYNLGLLRARAA